MLLKKCPKYNTSQYGKKGKSPSKVLWYFPIIPRFKRMFNNADVAKLLTWHANERIKDIKLMHPTDAPQWKKIDYEYPEFGEEPRNLWLVLAIDEINQHEIVGGEETRMEGIGLMLELVQMVRLFGVNILKCHGGCGGCELSQQEERDGAFLVRA